MFERAGFPKEKRNDLIPSSPLAGPMRPDAIISAGEFSEAAGAICGPRDAEMSGLGKIAGHMLIAGCFCSGDWMDASAYERPQL